MNYQRYHKIPEVQLEDRKWPSKVIEKAPIWCSVDLRDGNQALEVPMNLIQKLEFFDHLVSLGFKTIEIGFPAASETDYNFCRELIDSNRIPDDVAIQVLTQSRPHIIEKTMDAVYGAKNVVIHLYNSTSTLQRDVVFGFGQKECLDLAVSGAKMIKEYLDQDDSGTNWTLEYSPESFSSTEPDFAVAICDAVADVWQPTPDKKMIVNLPETVEYTLPNVYADMIEYFCTNTRWRDSILVSIHTHNDRGTGVAASELGILAGADRVEGTLFGNGERTGNVDIITLAVNMMMHGIDPGLDFSDMDQSIEIYERCTNMHVEPRHPWAGKLVFTAFSGSHQDAINKGKKKMAVAIMSRSSGSMLSREEAECLMSWSSISESSCLRTSRRISSASLRMRLILVRLSFCLSRSSSCLTITTLMSWHLMLSTGSASMHLVIRSLKLRQ